MGYFIALIVICVVGWFILKPLAGYLALRRDPISAGRTYIKRSLCRSSPINTGLISDEAYKQLANQAFQIAELSHTVERQSLFGCYMSYLDLYIQQIQIIMTGHATDSESPVVEILSKNRVPIPKVAASGTMPTFSSAQELVVPGETALCLFTDGSFLTLGQNGIGSSGFWFLNPHRPYQRIIIFRWSRRDGQRYVELFTALPAGLDGPETDGQFRGRYRIRLRHIHLAGTTNASWEDFVMTNEQVTYITRENAVS